jgi:hypothetical protein
VIDLALVRIFLAALSGWLDHQQQDVIAYLINGGADFFTTEVWTWRGLVTYYTLFVIR